MRLMRPTTHNSDKLQKEHLKNHLNVLPVIFLKIFYLIGFRKQLNSSLSILREKTKNYRLLNNELIKNHLIKLFL